jgi:hypothetical protein
MKKLMMFWIVAVATLPTVGGLIGLTCRRVAGRRGSKGSAQLARMRDGASARFFGANLRDFNAFERGKVSEPSSQIHFTAVH